MFLIDGKLHWSASDLTAAAGCEYTILRTLDYKLGWADPIEEKKDPFLEHIGRLGDRHEAGLLGNLQMERNVAVLNHIDPPYTMTKVQAAGEATREAFLGEPEVIYQAAFFDGEFFGYADFIERANDGWVVCDAKLARSAKPKALLQLGAYAHQVQQMGLPLSKTVSLLLGNGERADFRVSDVLPVFLERREQLRHLLASHQAGGVAVVWGDERLVACGKCPECHASATAVNDLIGVAGMRMEQRRKLHAAEPAIRTIADLAAATLRPARMAQATFEKLRAQAGLQWKQMQAADTQVAFELTATASTMLALLPAPSEGDLFFDFEGDPLYDEGDLSRVGLEYLWGVLDAAEKYTAIWAHSSAEERDAFISFMNLVAERRAHYPDMHIYHYAPYETTALKRLAMRYQTKEKALDDLLRSGVFVDLYATVRGSVRVGQPSYSIKKLEPLYMGDLLRCDDDDAVDDGGASVVAYHEHRELRVHDPAAAEARLVSLADYNRYDCLSTLRLRDWLLERAVEAGVDDQIVPRIKNIQGEELSDEDPLFLTLMAKSGPVQRHRRTPEEQAFAVLATSLDYYRREHKPYWWEHYERLGHMVDDWHDYRDVYVVESATIIEDWADPGGRSRNARRVLRLVGDWTPGSKANSRAQVVYPTPALTGSLGSDGAPYVVAPSSAVVSDLEDPRVILLTESRNPDGISSHLPAALVPGTPPSTKKIEAAIREVACKAAVASSLPHCGVLDILARRAPRLRGNEALPVTASTTESVVAALISMNDSYVAIQGPPGTGKTYTGARVVKELVEKHHWRIGVVAQSHAVVENLLAGIVEAGLDASLVGKDKVKSERPTWTALKNVPKFLSEHVATGCVIGGTVWDFANENTIARRSLDLLVVDEAGQFSLAATIGASIAAQRLLLLGDPQQLPQVSQALHAEPVNESALGWLMDGHDTIPTNFGYFLGQSYRMHPALCAKVSTLSYEGRLHSAPAAAGRYLDGVTPGLHVVCLDHTGNRTESEEEAAEVVAQVRTFLGKAWTDPDTSTSPRPLKECDFLVVAPYNAQVELIQRALKSADLSDVRVGTVDKFQGQEAPVAIVSTTASSYGDVPRGMGFLLNRNRVNVAVSRAKWRAVLIRSKTLTSFMPSSAGGFLELGAFIGLCQTTGNPDERTEIGESGKNKELMHE
ncbi:TM0106 family RecB-like putative nuclease [Kocuria sediminis]|uniref:TM0106 family RecB-like putative nuclease n=1 Tax=Kocuria sediminis TaxID=1038857 RepID=A0A6N8GNM7_9MICC|nr:bifunctional RecB family nuclease/DEAD/DEAH box helicase [Kocuria sediminis]MUN62873.1 TM0106 family RecB-like putative nuclease [Kocuria sediminis]